MAVAAVVTMVASLVVTGQLAAEPEPSTSADPLLRTTSDGAAAQTQQDGFSDVTEGVHAPAISALAQVGLFDGSLCGENRFCPDEPIERAIMAVWLIRALDDGEPPATGVTRFDDVDPEKWWSPHVERLAELEITVGCKKEPLRYCPDRAVTRAQMATFLVRAFDLAEAEPAGFADTDGSTHAERIDALAAAGITAGCKQDPLRYCPDRSVTRAQMATFLARALGLVQTPGPPRFSAVDAGTSHSCGLRTDGTITCWGSNADGQANAPTEEFKAVSAGFYHSCGLRTDGTITCWGWNPRFQGRSLLDAPSGTFTAVTAGLRYTCGLRTNGTITCWGSNSNGETDSPAGSFSAITAGAYRACGLRTNGWITCWGSDYVEPGVTYNRGPLEAPAGTFTEVTSGGHS